MVGIYTTTICRRIDSIVVECGMHNNFHLCNHLKKLWSVYGSKPDNNNHVNAFTYDFIGSCKSKVWQSKTKKELFSSKKHIFERKCLTDRENWSEYHKGPKTLKTFNWSEKLCFHIEKLKQNEIIVYCQIKKENKTKTKLPKRWKCSKPNVWMNVWKRWYRGKMKMV